jgi:CHAD domain-containing protein
MNGPAALASTSATAGPYLTTKLHGLDARLQQVEPRVRATQQDADACHDLRVALRRTRTVLEVGRKVLGRFHADEVRRALRDLQRATGALRDEEVLLEVVAALGVDRPDVTTWVETRRRREHAQRLALMHLVQAGQLQHGRELLGALLAFRVDPSRDRRLAKFAKRAVDRARREVERQRAAGLDDASALHDLRIAYKRLRYTVEALTDALPSDMAALAATAAKIQKRLGDVHDVDVAIGAVRRARTLTEEGRADLLAALYRLRENRIGAYARELGVAVAPSVPPEERIERQAAGADSLRKISTR